jgi:hypothetical protein
MATMLKRLANLTQSHETGTSHSPCSRRASGIDPVEVDLVHVWPTQVVLFRKAHNQERVERVDDGRAPGVERVGGCSTDGFDLVMALA